MIQEGQVIVELEYRVRGIIVNLRVIFIASDGCFADGNVAFSF